MREQDDREVLVKAMTKIYNIEGLEDDNTLRSVVRKEFCIYVSRFLNNVTIKTPIDVMVLAPTALRELFDFALMGKITQFKE